MSRKALWMPEGSIRGLMALGSVAITGTMLLTSLSIPNEWWAAQSAIITFYYVGGASTDTAKNINGHNKETNK